MEPRNFSPIETGSKMIRKTKKPMLTIETGNESPPKFVPSKSGLAIETFSPKSPPRFMPLKSGLEIEISPPRFAIPMGTSPPISSLMTLGNLSPEHETIISPTQKISEIKSPIEDLDI